MLRVCIEDTVIVDVFLMAHFESHAVSWAPCSLVHVSIAMAVDRASFEPSRPSRSPLFCSLKQTGLKLQPLAIHPYLATCFQTQTFCSVQMRTSFHQFSVTCLDSSGQSGILPKQRFFGGYTDSQFSMRASACMIKSGAQPPVISISRASHTASFPEVPMENRNSVGHGSIQN